MFRWSKIFKKQRQVNHFFNLNEFKFKLILMNEWVTNYFNFNVFVLRKALDFTYLEYSQLFIRDAQRWMWWVLFPLENSCRKSLKEGTNK
jgi:hypothetical protein